MNILFFLTPKSEVACIKEADSLRQALEKMEHRGYSAVPLISNQGMYIGTVTEGDILYTLKEKGFPSLQQMEKISVMQIARRRDNCPVHIEADMDSLIERALNQNFIPVIDDNHIFIGIVTRKDIINRLADEKASLVKEAIDR